MQLKKADEFTHFIGIDWSGAKGMRQKGIAVAICEIGNAAPAIVPPPSGHTYWSRQDVIEWIESGCGLTGNYKVLIGIDAAYGMPYLDEGGYFERGDFEDVRSLWSEIGRFDNADYFAGSFIETYADHFQQPGGQKGKCYNRRMRQTETICIETGAGPCESVFNLVGASQVGKSALSVMMMLNKLDTNNHIAIWPFDPLVNKELVLVEIYAALFAKMGGHKGKMRSRDELNNALYGLQSKPYLGNLPKKIDDATDALITSAGLRHIACDGRYWKPEKITIDVVKTEGWVFGIL